jgi:5-methyltetrahydrofolate--homocysteine methyltransferase
VTTVGANQKAAMEAMETIRYCKEELSLASICGLSNISFGLPERSYVNASFLTMAIQAGLTMAIANPNQELLFSSALAADLLLNKENADIRYIEHIGRIKERAMNQVESSPSVAVVKPVEINFVTETKLSFESVELEHVYHGVLKGNKSKIIELTKEALSSGLDASAILNQALLPAINQVGEYFDKGKYFLPQLIASAETMKQAIEHLEPLLLQAGGSKEMPVIIIATVEGDIHDIGKNLVGLMLKNHGFRVIDLGKDVSKEKIITSAIENKADIIALSALMTTTMKEMKHVIDYAKVQGVNAKVMIGGAVITQDYADEIGADGFSKDAADAVKLAKRLMEENHGNF